MRLIKTVNPGAQKQLYSDNTFPSSAVCAANALLPPPTMLEAALVVMDSVAYAWRNPDDVCDPSTISFYQRMLDNDTEVNITIPLGPLGSDVLVGLTPFTNYSIRVRYVCVDNRMSDFSDPLMVQTSQGSEHSTPWRDMYFICKGFSMHACV